MKGKQLATILLLLAAVGGVALVINSRRAKSWHQTATASEGKLLNFPLNDVSHLTIKDGSAELNLLKKDDLWKVKERFDYPANFDKVAGLIRKLWELRAAQDVRIGPSQFARLQLIEPGKESNSGTLIELKGNDDKRIAALLVGKKHLRKSDESFGQGGIPTGRYVMALDGSNRVCLVSETFDEAEAQPERWVNQEFVSVENPKAITLTGPSPGTTWKLVRDNASGPWKFADPKPNEELDNGKAASLAALFARPTFFDVLDPNKPLNETGLDKPSTARIETLDNFVYELRFGKLMGENYPVQVAVTADLPKERPPGKDEKPEDKTRLDQEFQTKQKQLTDKLAKEKKLETWRYLMAKSTIDQLVADRSTLLAEKTPSPSPASPSPTPGAKGASVTTSPVAAPGKADRSPSPARPKPR